MASSKLASKAGNKNQACHSGNQSMWVVALLALVAGLVTEPLWQMYLESLEEELQHPLPSSDRLLLTNDKSGNAKNTPQYSCSPADLSNFLHEFDVPGMHVICLDPFSSSLTIYNQSSTLPGRVLSETLEEDKRQKWSYLRSVLKDKLDLPVKSDMKQAWALFTPTGTRLRLGDDTRRDASTEPLYDLGMFLLIEGGQWLWPGVRKGFVRHIQLDDTHNATLETLSTHPLVFSVDGFLTDEECDWIRTEAAPSMSQSGVSLMDRDKGMPATNWRTSETTFLHAKTPEIREIDRRTSQLVRIPENHQEPPQVLKYGLDARYDQHTDYFDPRFYANDLRTMAMIANGRKNRMATVLWYLNDVAQGGETTFPQMDDGPAVLNPQACKVGLQVKPEKGKVIIFYSLKPDGSTDTLSLHAACPVKEGEKWAANKWIWNEPWSWSF